MKPCGVHWTLRTSTALFLSSVPRSRQPPRLRPLPRHRTYRPRRVPLGTVVRQDECLNTPAVCLTHQSHEILPQARKRLLHAIIGLELLYGIAVAAARLQQRARHREVGGERPPQLDLLTDRRHFRPQVEHMRDAVPPQHLAVNTGQQLGIPQLDPVTKVPRQLLEEIIELVSP